MKKLPDFSQYYAEGYNDTLYGKGLMPWCIRQSHKLVEKAFGKNDHFENVVEIGAGLGQHLNFVKHSYSSYTFVEMNDAVIEKLKKQGLPDKVKLQKVEDYRLPFPDNTVDRLVAVHVFEHMHYPEKVLAEWSRVVKKGGIISILVPCDPGMAWRLGRLVSARGRARKNGLKEYDLFMALEHVNPINVMCAVIRYGFDSVRKEWWPLKVPLLDVNLFCAFHIRNDS